jgi:hypothetical protein
MPIEGASSGGSPATARAPLRTGLAARLGTSPQPAQNPSVAMRTQTGMSFGGATKPRQATSGAGNVPLRASARVRLKGVVAGLRTPKKPCAPPGRGLPFCATLVARSGGCQWFGMVCRMALRSRSFHYRAALTACRPPAEARKASTSTQPNRGRRFMVEALIGLSL